MALIGTRAALIARLAPLLSDVPLTVSNTQEGALLCMQATAEDPSSAAMTTLLVWWGVLDPTTCA